MIGNLQRYPSSERATIEREVLDALESRVELGDVKSFLDPADEAANAKLRAELSGMLSNGDELWWFSAPFIALSGMAGYAIVSDGALKDFRVIVQS